MVGVIWTIVSGRKTSNDLRNLEAIVKPIFQSLTDQQTEGRKAKKQELGLLDKHRLSDQELMRLKLDLEQRQFQWKQMTDAARALGWFFTHIEEEQEEDEDYLE